MEQDSLKQYAELKWSRLLVYFVILIFQLNRFILVHIILKWLIPPLYAECLFAEHVQKSFKDAQGVNEGTQLRKKYFGVATC